jgi:sulfhydrogenase subunit beta (sulfur reductase)
VGEGNSIGLLKIPKTGLDAFVDALAEAAYIVFAPVEEGEATKFGALDRGHIKIPYLTTRPVKELFFPQDEALFSFDCSRAQDASIKIPEVSVSCCVSPRVAIGVRPCDARALVLLDRVFASNDYMDPYYMTRREQTVIITFACPLPGIACFCTSTGGGPYDETGSDVMFMELADSYLVRIISEKGKRLLREVLPLLEGDSCKCPCVICEADDTDIKAARDVRIASEESLAANLHSNVPIEAAVDTLGRPAGFSDSAWEEVYRKCLGCAVCTYLCPTCHCFDIGDEVTNDRGERIRTWDSCMFPLFTLHASGHNPRPSGKERFRQRVMHKFNYFVETKDCVACVGCGRCVENCPVNLDIRQVLEAFARREFA